MRDMQASISGRWSHLSEFKGYAPGVICFTLAVPCFSGLVPVFLFYGIRLFCRLVWTQEKGLGGIYCKAGVWTWVTYIYGQTFPRFFGFFLLSLLYQVLKDCNGLGSSFYHSFPGYPVSGEKHQIREEERPMISGHCVKHSSLQDLGDPT